MTARPHRSRRSLLPRFALTAGLGLALLTSPLVALPASPASAVDFVPGHQTRFPLPDANAKPTAIVTGADGALWIAESNGHAIVRMTTDGSTTRYPIPSGASPTDLAAGPDGTIWWVAQADNIYGLITKSGDVQEWIPPLDAQPAAVTVGTDGSGWFLRPGTFYKLRAFSSPESSSGAAGNFEVPLATSPTSVEAINGKIWVSDAAANLIVILSQTGVFEKSVTIPGPSAMTEGDGGVYVVSANSGIVKLNLDGTPTGNEWHDAGTPLITDVVVPALGEQWFTKLRDQRVTVRSQGIDILPSRFVDLPDAGIPSDLAVGPDGAIWYTALGTSEVVRIARDFEAPTRFQNGVAPDLMAYVGEPLGPVRVNDRGSGIVTTEITGSLPDGMTRDSSRTDTLVGSPITVSTSLHVVESRNVYYGGRSSAAIFHQRKVVVRDEPAVQRVGGKDRYEAAVNASRARFPGAAGRVYVASGEKFADALSAGPVAIAAGAPLLLTTGGVLPTVVEAELKRLNPGSVVVVGGPASVSDAVVAKIRGAVGGTATVTRIGGVDRYEVSRKLVETGPASTTMYLASGLTYPDALSAAPVASAGKNSVLLVDGSQSRLPDETLVFLAARGATTVKLAGGPASISDGIKTQLEAARIQVTRLGGANRYETSTIVNRDVLMQPGVDSRVPSNPVPLVHSDTVYLASGENYPDALAGGVAAGLEKAPLYITPKNCVPRTVLLDIGSTGATKVVVLGGPNTLAAPVESLTVCP